MVQFNRTRWMKFSLRFLLMVMLMTAVVAAQYRPRNVDVELRMTKLNPQQQTALLEFTNHSYNKVWVYGYAANSPLYAMEGQAGPKKPWQPMGPIGWCGTGAGLHPVKRGETIEISAFVRAPGNITKARCTFQVWKTSKQDQEPVSVVSEPFAVR